MTPEINETHKQVEYELLRRALFLNSETAEALRKRIEMAQSRL